jgi:imidazolonepropionase
MTTLITNIKQLVNVREESRLLRGNELAKLPCIENAYLIIDKGMITEFGEMKNLKPETLNFKQVIDVPGQFILPCWCDSHTHLVFAASREEEFVDKIKGTSYAEIAAKGGGILNSAKRLNEMDIDELYNLSLLRLQEVIKLGTGAIEIKSGYGLSVAGELKMLGVIKRLKENSPIPIKSTFLGAHTYPVEYKENHQGYIDLIIMKCCLGSRKINWLTILMCFASKAFFPRRKRKLFAKRE